MSDTLWGAVIGASSAVAAMAIGQLVQWLREGDARMKASDVARADRLRALYVDAYEIAIGVTPAGFGYRFDTDHKPSVERADNIRARLEIEAVEDGQEVLTSFVKVVSSSRMYDSFLESNPGHVPDDELRKEEQLVRGALREIEDACRQRLAALS